MCVSYNNDKIGNGDVVLSIIPVLFKINKSNCENKLNNNIFTLISISSIKMTI